MNTIQINKTAFGTVSLEKLVFCTKMEMERKELRIYDLNDFSEVEPEKQAALEIADAIVNGVSKNTLEVDPCMMPDVMAAVAHEIGSM